MFKANESKISSFCHTWQKPPSCCLKIFILLKSSTLFSWKGIPIIELLATVATECAEPVFRLGANNELRNFFNCELVVQTIWVLNEKRWWRKDTENFVYEIECLVARWAYYENSCHCVCCVAYIIARTVCLDVHVAEDVVDNTISFSHWYITLSGLVAVKLWSSELNQALKVIGAPENSRFCWFPILDFSFKDR